MSSKKGLIKRDLKKKMGVWAADSWISEALRGNKPATAEGSVKYKNSQTPWCGTLPLHASHDQNLLDSQPILNKTTRKGPVSPQESHEAMLIKT